MSYQNLKVKTEIALTVSAAATPQRLVELPTSPATKVCGTRIWIGAPRAADGTANNTRELYYGDSASQLASVAATDFDGRWLPTGDPYEVYIRVKVNGEKVVAQVWG
jgi:hypothetical protein